MSITLITGKPGSGKTVFALSGYIKPELQKGRIVYTNGIPDLKFQHIELTNEDLNRWDEREPVEGRKGVYELTTIKEDALIVVDEAADVWPALHLKTIPEFLQYLRKHRKHAIDFLLLTQDPHFLHPHVLLNVDRHIHLVTDWRGTYSYEWPEYCVNPIMPSNQARAVSKPYKLDKSVFSEFYSATKHLPKQKRSIPKMVYAAIFMLFAVPAMGYMSYATISSKLENPIGVNLAKLDETKTEETAKQGVDSPKTGMVPVVQPATDNTPVKQSLSMLSESVDWDQVAACMSSKSHCVCYGHKAQRLNIDPNTCNAAIDYGWMSKQVSKSM
ncbi:MAG: zonular occludens toxin [Nitrosomonas sp.]|uniref:zonular occludens toxin domain-containing protein n=1 Tax=Nitrosomonas sp. TaxID=42353 RepID=UPI0032EFD771